jgi:prepilin-type N-terminal cleavage/methylation domain-containing protein
MIVDMRVHRAARGGYVLLEMIIALTVFAIVVTGLARVLHSSLDAANLLRRQAAIRHGLESILVEAKTKPKREEMRMSYKDDALGVEFRSETRRAEMGQSSAPPGQRTLHLARHRHRPARRQTTSRQSGGLCLSPVTFTP